MKVQTSIWVDKEDKKEIKKILIDRNQNLSCLINNLIKKFIKENNDATTKNRNN
ncbi:MAG TPA: hypothetical protein P5277_02615 [Candidatus Paceibacterota bacterium]|nr:hypothetical protein [Candidatus Paceibacterota bacterium]